ncbi:MAG: hypothetical protein BSOLF_0830 [Candidatus Carbobacillus altaicus]|uniref:Uncharacterized protein n=1 Tax=Candidatus Carbonibacillus altaicus TaxID=2163959 RepID=A0A2R6Y076_9BACL|nr:MAG: hypothetical protein BSOLF_0830 [Candidatus Carbobacillus altaicus]
MAERIEEVFLLLGVVVFRMLQSILVMLFTFLVVALALLLVFAAAKLVCALFLPGWAPFAL